MQARWRELRKGRRRIGSTILIVADGLIDASVRSADKSTYKTELAKEDKVSWSVQADSLVLSVLFLHSSKKTTGPTLYPFLQRFLKLNRSLRNGDFTLFFYELTHRYSYHLHDQRLYSYLVGAAIPVWLLSLWHSICIYFREARVEHRSTSSSAWWCHALS